MLIVKTEELETHHPNLSVLVTMSGADDTDWSGPRGRVSKELINNFVPNIREKRVHICGPPSMMGSVKSMLSELEVPSHMIKLENFGTDKRRPGSIAEEELGEVVGGVRFRLSGISAEIRERETLLDVADGLGIEIDNACRSGTCGTCKVQLLAGSVVMDCEDALMEDEKSDGVILACQAMSRGDVEIDA